MPAIQQVIDTMGWATIAGFAAGLVVTIAVLVVAWLFRARIRRWLAGVSDDESSSAGLAALLIAFSVMGLTLLAAAQLIAAMGFLAGVRIGPWHIVISAAVAISAGYWTARSLCSRKATQVWAVACMLFAIAVLASVSVAGSFYDVSWDGNATYQQAVVRLATGWDPIVRDAGIPASAGTEFWIQVYPKGSWIDGAAFYALTGHLEQAKSPRLLLIGVVFSLCLALLLVMAPRRRLPAVLTAAVVALNPIATVQAFTFMYDGEIASLLTAWLLLAALLWTRAGRRPVLLGLGATTLLLANTKYTALVYVIVFAAGLVAAVAFRPPRAIGRAVVIVSVLAALILGVLFVGYNPYVLNTVQHGSPFYPLLGPGSMNLMAAHMPGNFAGVDGVTKLLLSVFSRSADVGSYGPGTTTVLKVPFSVTLAELRPFAGPVARVGGLGPWFGGALILGLAAALILLIDPKTRRDRVVWAVFAADALILLSVLVNPESWWARYAPQLWLVPLLPAVAVVYRSEVPWRRATGYFVIAVMLADAAVVGAVSLAGQVYATHRVTLALEAFRNSPDPVSIQQREFLTSWAKFEDLGIAYRIVPDAVDRPGGVHIPYLDLVVYPGK